jgi:hypothetical protein
MEQILSHGSKVQLLRIAATSFLIWASVCGAQPPASEAAVFERIASVLTHPRCLNCHTSVDFPTQGDERRRHQMNVQRGPHDKGAVAMQCSNCHQTANNAASGVPGAPNWHLAPLSMSWENMDNAALCRALLDPKKNGNRGVAELVDHMEHDALVAWGWAPGANRKPVPIGKDEFVSLLKTWAGAGAPCPR